MVDATKPFKTQRMSPGTTPCSHDYPMLVNRTSTGHSYSYYYARCIRCLAVGPERPSSEAARKALVVLGARSDGQQY